MSNSTIIDSFIDGSGSAPYRTSPSFLLFVIQSLIIGAFLLILGKKFLKLTSILGMFLIFEVLTWVVIINKLPADGFNSSFSPSVNGILTFVVMLIFGLIGGVAGFFVPRVGIYGMVLTGGCAFALSIVLMGENVLNSTLGRWIVIGVFVIVVGILASLYERSFGVALATALAGSFLLVFGIDLLVNETDGLSLGIRLIFASSSRQPIPLTYSPPVSTRALLAISYVISFLSAVFQSLRNNDPVKDADSGSLRTNDDNLTHTFTEKIQRRFDLVSEEKAIGHSPFGSMNQPIINHPQEMSDPNEPASRPSSIISTRLADGLRSRAPTCFDVPFTSSPLPDFSGFLLPGTAIAGGGAAAIAEEYHHHEVEEIGTLASTIKRNSDTSLKSLDSRKSWRKPVPADKNTSTHQPIDPSTSSTTHQQNEDFDRGLSSGRDFHLAPSVAPSNYSEETSGILAGFSSGTVIDSDYHHHPTSATDSTFRGETGELSPTDKSIFGGESFRTAASRNNDSREDVRE